MIHPGAPGAHADQRREPDCLRLRFGSCCTTAQELVERLHRSWQGNTDIW